MFQEVLDCVYRTGDVLSPTKTQEPYPFVPPTPFHAIDKETRQTCKKLRKQLCQVLTKLHSHFPSNGSLPSSNELSPEYEDILNTVEKFLIDQVNIWQFLKDYYDCLVCYHEGLSSAMESSVAKLEQVLPLIKETYTEDKYKEEVDTYNEWNFYAKKTRYLFDGLTMLHRIFSPNLKKPTEYEWTFEKVFQFVETARLSMDITQTHWLQLQEYHSNLEKDITV